MHVFSICWCLPHTCMLIIPPPHRLHPHVSPHRPAACCSTHPSPPSFPPTHMHSYIGILGLLLPGFSYTGMDGPAHMSEETVGAAMGPPLAIMAGGWVGGWEGGRKVLQLFCCYLHACVCWYRRSGDTQHDHFVTLVFDRSGPLPVAHHGCVIPRQTRCCLDCY